MLNFAAIHPSWSPLIKKALERIDPVYLEALSHDKQWLPGPQQIFNAFQLPLPQTQYILLGESPYPRQTSANGYAFWDAATHSIWSDTGLDKMVNRATSLRNFIKMLLVAQGDLSIQDTGQAAISALDKKKYIQTTEELFQNLMQSGFLLLNASLVLSTQAVRYDAKHWQPFLIELLTQLATQKHSITLVLMGKIAEEIAPISTKLSLDSKIFEHPYNLSFISNQTVQSFFKSFNLLTIRDKMHGLDQ